MKLIHFATGLTVLLACGCAGKKPVPLPAPAAPAGPVKIITPDLSLSAKVVSVNAMGRYVVLDISGGKMPKVGQTLYLYRGGLRVGEARVTGPELDNNTVADVIAGEANAGDDVRDR